MGPIMSDVIPLNAPELAELLRRLPVSTLPDTVALKSDIPTMTGYALKTDLPSLVGYALKTDLPSLVGYALKTDIPGAVDLSSYALKASTPTILSGSYTIAQLMALDPAVNVRKYAYCSDLYGVGDMMLSDGVNWKPVRPFGVQTQGVTADTVLTTLMNAPTQLFTGTMSVQRNVSLSTQYAYRGARFRVTRTAGGPLYNLVVGGVNLAINQWMDFEYDGTAFVKTASGGLF